MALPSWLYEINRALEQVRARAAIRCEASASCYVGEITGFGRVCCGYDKVWLMNFAALKWSGHCYQTQVKLPEWAEFQERLGAYGGLSSPDPSDGNVALMFEAPDESWQVSRAQQAAYLALLENGALLRDAILAELLQLYPQWQSLYSYEEDEAELMPNVAASDDFKPLIGLSIVHILTMEQAGLAYVGFEFGCTWDEHGLGALTHGHRVLQLGGAEDAFSVSATENAHGFDPAQPIREAQAARQRALSDAEAARKPDEPTQLSLFD